MAQLKIIQSSVPSKSHTPQKSRRTLASIGANNYSSSAPEPSATKDITLDESVEVLDESVQEITNISNVNDENKPNNINVVCSPIIPDKKASPRKVEKKGLSMSVTIKGSEDPNSSVSVVDLTDSDEEDSKPPNKKYKQQVSRESNDSIVILHEATKDEDRTILIEDEEKDYFDLHVVFL